MALAPHEVSFSTLVHTKKLPHAFKDLCRLLVVAPPSGNGVYLVFNYDNDTSVKTVVLKKWTLDWLNINYDLRDEKANWWIDRAAEEEPKQDFVECLAADFLTPATPAPDEHRLVVVFQHTVYSQMRSRIADSLVIRTVDLTHETYLEPSHPMRRTDVPAGEDGFTQEGDKQYHLESGTVNLEHKLGVLVGGKPGKITHLSRESWQFIWISNRINRDFDQRAHATWYVEACGLTQKMAPPTEVGNSNHFLAKQTLGSLVLDSAMLHTIQFQCRDVSMFGADGRLFLLGFILEMSEGPHLGASWVEPPAGLPPSDRQLAECINMCLFHLDLAESKVVLVNKFRDFTGHTFLRDVGYLYAYSLSMMRSRKTHRRRRLRCSETTAMILENAPVASASTPYCCNSIHLDSTDSMDLDSYEPEVEEGVITYFAYVREYACVSRVSRHMLYRVQIPIGVADPAAALRSEGKAAQEAGPGGGARIETLASYTGDVSLVHAAATLNDKEGIVCVIGSKIQCPDEPRRTSETVMLRFPIRFPTLRELAWWKIPGIGKDSFKTISPGVLEELKQLMPNNLRGRV